MRAVILCGGLGTRLQPYTFTTPKPLVPINDKPILDYVIDLLIKNNFTHITLALNHQASLFKDYIKYKNLKKIKIDYSIESKKLGTMGPLKLINDLPDNFLVMNADILTNANIKNFFSKHINSKNNFSILSTSRFLPSEFGVLNVNKEKLTGFFEKPNYKLKVSTGIYALNNSITKLIPNKYFGFDNLVNKLLKKKDNINVFSHSGYWFDIGRPDDYHKAINFINKKEIVHKK